MTTQIKQHKNHNLRMAMKRKKERGESITINTLPQSNQEFHHIYREGTTATPAYPTYTWHPL